MEYDIVTLNIRVDGESVPLQVNPNKMHESWLQKVVEYGCRRFPNDSFSGEKGEDKVKLIRDLIAEMESGEAMPEKVRKSVTVKDPVLSLALRNAKASLQSIFKAKGFGGKIAEFENHEPAAKYFSDGVWIDQVVIDWMDGKPGGRDYRAEAESTLNADI